MAEKEPKTASFDEESSVDTLSISGQIAKESANEIQYRTCSWQKVCVSFRGVKASQRIGAADRRLAVLGVYLPCHSVLPLVRIFFFGRGESLVLIWSSRSYSVLGLVPGVIVTVAVAATVQYTCQAHSLISGSQT
jgi:hypothetical protein